ncbi:MAG: hypothetical protein Q8O20_04415 [Sulfuricurvum sp.]|uniref:hypothetical protein n=1 Tax=Sulfuricurvum sp. TaxID=2025608 RepID=UPI002733A557|nr:hypothetical protein [Sulfuricurvum sp.]MDP2850296.1 hypothetical protein [Sulfuricurvum sp.]
MPRSATFSVTAAGAHSSAHNSREEKPKYLIGTSPGSENLYDLRHSDADFLALAEAKYKETTGQKMQQKQKDALIKETVLSLETHHTAADVQKVFDELSTKYGGHYITELSIHRDEGHFEDENGITYYPTKDILQKGDEWYSVPLAESITHAPDYRPKAEEFSEKVDIKDFKPVHNHHAHVKFSMFDPRTGKTGRMQHKDLNDRINTAARVLKLEYKPEKKSDKRSTVAEIKVQHKAVRNEKVTNYLEHGLTIQAKNREIVRLEYNFREAQKRISAMEALDVEQKKELHRLNTEINKTKDDEAKAKMIEELENRLTESTKIVIEAQNALSEAQNTIEAQKREIERLKAENVEKDKVVMEAAVKVGAFSSTSPTFRSELIAPKIAEVVEQITAKAKHHSDHLVDMIAEIHSAVEHQDPDISKIVHRQREVLNYKRNTAEPYKTAIERRNNAYKARLEQNRSTLNASKNDIYEVLTKIEQYNAQHEKPKGLTIKGPF